MATKRRPGVRALRIAATLGVTCLAVASTMASDVSGAAPRSALHQQRINLAATTDLVQGTGHDGHAQHQQMMRRQSYARSAHDYALPDLVLRDSDGNETTLQQVLDTDKPVLLNFIYTTCTTICPVLSATFSQVQRDLGDEAHRVRMISITIDPDQDTPQRLREYAERFHAGPQWRFITGDRGQIIEVQKAFDSYRGAKTNHEPITLLRAPRATSWVRIEGIASAREIISEYHALASVTE